VKLTPREYEIMTMVSKGHTNKRIAWLLEISDQTVKNHVSNVYPKLGATNRITAIIAFKARYL